MVNLLPAEPVGDAVPMAEPMSQQEIAAHNIASGLQTGQISNPSALTQVQVADTALINILPSTWRQPTRHEANGDSRMCSPDSDLLLRSQSSRGPQERRVPAGNL
jgi:hypothetical protein